MAMTTETTRATGPTQTTRPRPAHLRTGERGEALAARYLEDQGLTVLAKNWRCPEGELDLVLTDGRTLVVCEVKTRSGLGSGTPHEAITETKLARLKRLGQRWASAREIP